MLQLLRRLTALAALLLAALALGGCTGVMDRLVRSMTDSATLETGETVISHMMARDAAALSALIHPDAETVFTEELLSQIFDYLPETGISRLTAVQSNWSSFSLAGGERTRNANLIFRADFEPDSEGIARNEFIMVGLFARGDAALQVAQIRIFPVPGPVYGGVSGWPAGFWAAVILAPLAALLCLTALISAWRTPRLKRRILWSLFILFIGYPVFAFSTGTNAWILQSPGIHSNGGMVSLDFIRVTILSAGWMVDTISGQHSFQVALPLGSLLFFLQKARGKLALKPVADQSKPDAPEPDKPAAPAA